ncbi:hypothetical protein ACFLXV_04145, partial [Chloroflexota bacterium]
GSLIKRAAELCVNCGVRVSGGQPRRSGKRGPGWVTAGGIFAALAGVLAIAPGIAMVVNGSTDYCLRTDWAEIGFGISFLVAGLLAIVGSIFAITRRNFSLALMGGICALWPMWFFGVPALVLIAISSEQFQPAGETA